MLQLDLARWWTERVTKAIKVISSDHALIHEGESFYAYSKASIASAGTLKFTLTTPATEYVHFRPSVISSSGDKITMTMTEVPTSVSGGSAMTSYNRNRLSSKAAAVALKSGVTLTESAVVVDASYIGGGTGQGSTRSGAETNENDEIVLKQNTIYSITLLNESSAANVVFMKLKWYEEEGA
jgi:hypothetical protein